MELRDIPHDDRRRYLWLILLRGGLIIILIGGWGLAQTGAYHRGPLFILLGLIILFTGISLVWLQWTKTRTHQTAFLYLQVVWDPFFTSALILFTGGSESIFSFLYLFGIVSASIFLHLRGAVLIASLSAILYGGFLDLEYYQILNPSGVAKHDPAREYFFAAGANIAAYFAVAILASYLSERLRRTEAELERRSVDLKSLRAFHQKIVESIGSGVLTFDSSGNILSLNRAGADILGRSIRDILGKKMADIFPPLEDEIRKWDQDKGIRSEICIEREGNPPTYLGFSISSLRGDLGEELGKIMIFQDVTRVKEMEQEIFQSEKLAAIGTLAAGIAHEIRNPLNAISGSLQLLSEHRGAPEEENRLMRIVLNETERLNRLITNFLLFARPEKPRISEFDPVTVLDECLDLIAHSPDFPSEVSISKRYESHHPIHADVYQIRQLFLNLLINAGQAMPEGGTLTIRTRAEHANGFIEIDLTDEGTGMDEQTQARIFEPFFTTKDRGSGLGLAIVHRIVELHRGRINVQSHPGQGTTFLITLPTAEEHHGG